MADKTSKKPKLGDDDDSNEPFDDKLLLSIEKLSEIQEELEKINDQESDKVLEVEQKYSEIRKPFYERRKDVIKSIPDFWFTALIGHPALGMLISEEDHKMLKHLKSLEVEDLKNVKAGYSITLIFEPNPFFENAELTKTYSFLEEGTTEITATPIKWKLGMENFKGTPNGRTQGKKGKKRAIAIESFFSWFCDTQDESIDIQDEIAEIIKDDLWPNPLAYISMEADEEADEDDEGEKDGDDSEEEDDEEDDDDNDNEDEENIN